MNFAVGVSGMEVSRDYRGEADASGKVMAVTNIAEVDEIAVSGRAGDGKGGRGTRGDRAGLSISAR